MDSVQSQSIDSQFNEFSYKPVPPLAPVTLCLGICSATALLSLAGLAIGAVGILLGLVCLLRIRKANGEMGGRLLTWIGVVLSVLFLASGSSLHAYYFATEVPEGYQRINFTRDIAKKGFVLEEGVTRVNADVRALDGKKIFLKGYMYPTRQTKNIESFVLVKDNLECCFGGQPKQSDMILVKMQKGKTVEFTTGLIAIAGVFHSEKAQQSGDLVPVYELKGFQFNQARTSF